jgi:hypothetical protein
MEMMRVPSSRGGKLPQSDEPFFSVVESVIHERDALSAKYQLSVLEAQAVLGEIDTALGFIPLVSHRPV